jgi:hypothetical protein
MGGGVRWKTHTRDKVLQDIRHELGIAGA